MAAEITDDHLAAFATESTWDALADALVAKYGGIVDRLVLYNPAGDTPERFERYGAVREGDLRRAAERGDRPPGRSRRPR